MLHVLPSSIPLTCLQQIKNWFGNHANSSLPDGLPAAKVAKTVLGSLLTGASGKPKHRQMLKAYFAFHEMDRERLDPILRDAWEAEKKVKMYDNNDHRLAFTNDLLKALLAKEPKAKRDAVDRFRKDDLERRKAEDKLADAAENDVLLECEHDLPVEERERLTLVRSRHR